MKRVKTCYIFIYTLTQKQPNTLAERSSNTENYYQNLKSNEDMLNFIGEVNKQTDNLSGDQFLEVFGYMKVI